MRLRLLPSGFAADGRTASSAQPLTTYLVEGANGAGPLAIDAGSLGLWGEAEDAASVRAVILTHAHLDHVASLAMWVEAILSRDGAPAVVHASDEAIATLRTHVFNASLFPDFEALTERDGRPLLRFVSIPIDAPFPLAGFSVRAVPVHHAVPTHGLLIDDGQVAVAVGADSGPTDRLWQRVAEHPRMRAVVLECSFPDSMRAIAEASGHLTPELLALELERVPDGVEVWIAHRKPAYREEIAKALMRSVGRDVRLFEPGAVIELS